MANEVQGGGTGKMQGIQEAVTPNTLGIPDMLLTAPCALAGCLPSLCALFWPSYYVGTSLAKPPPATPWP